MILFCLEMLPARKRFSDSLASFETCILVVVWRNWKTLCYGSCLIPLSLVTLHFSNLVLEIEVLMTCSWEWGSVQLWAWELLCLGTSCLEPSRTYSNQFAGQLDHDCIYASTSRPEVQTQISLPDLHIIELRPQCLRWTFWPSPTAVAGQARTSSTELQNQKPFLTACNYCNTFQTWPSA